MTCDILFCAWNRKAFTVKALEVLLANTEWDLISNLILYDDGSSDGTRDYLRSMADNLTKCELRCTSGLGPVGIMRDYLQKSDASAPAIFAKLDSDTLVPLGWLGECLKVMEAEPGLDLLGIEARIDAEKAGPGPRTILPAEFIGGIGLFRRSAFRNLPEPDGPRSRFGFTAWQVNNREVRKAWLSPPLPVCLLNLVPFEPWALLSKEYVAQKWQRDWPGPYAADRSELWEWWA